MLDPDIFGLGDLADRPTHEPATISVAALRNLLETLTLPPIEFPSDSPTRRIEVLALHTGRCQVARAVNALIEKVGG